MSDLHLTEAEKEYLNQQNKWEGIFGIDPYQSDDLTGLTAELWEACKPKLPDSNNFGVPLIFGTFGGDSTIDLGPGIYEQLKMEWENLE